MFGNDDGGNGDHGGFSLGQLLFALFMWRELESGRLDAGAVFKVLFLIVAVIGGGFLLLLLVVGASMPRYDGGGYQWSPEPAFTQRPAFVPAWTPAPVWTAEPEPTPEPTLAPSPTPRAVGKADLRFSGAYKEHYVANVYAEADLLDPEDPDSVDDPAFQNVCRFRKELGKKAPVLAGFYLASNRKSREPWTLTLDDLTVSWAMSAWFTKSTDALTWYSDFQGGTLKRTKTGFTFDVRMTDFQHTLRVRGTVTCR